MVGRIKYVLLIRLLLWFSGIKLGRKTPVRELGLSEYVETTMAKGLIWTVGDAIHAYYLNEKNDGLGVKSWEEFFKCVQDLEDFKGY